MLLAVLALGGGLWGFMSSRTESNKLPGTLVFTNSGAAQAPLRGITQKDSDTDGLFDWEEMLWKTDPNNPDTDGDGTNDGDEIKLKRNPLKPGPDDALPDDFLHQQTQTNEPDEKLTQTQLLTRDFISTYLKLKQTDQFTPENQEKLVSSFMEEALSRAQTTENPARSLEELTIEDEAGIIPISQYAQALESALGKNFSYSFFGQELILLKNILEKKDSRTIAVFGEAEKAYRNLADELLKTRVPREIAVSHIALINSALVIAKSFSDIMLLPTDPLQALTGVKRYDEELVNFGKYLSDISSYILRVTNEAENKLKTKN
ncbi:MAG: hypothetical protein HYT28_01010 [Parcubacteria group bacterium]|nr:hypothetical protein [Parcubacteria group bacterium]